MHEEHFIITASRLSLVEEDIVLLKESSQKIDNWESIIQVAVMHGVAPLIYYTIKTYGLSNLLPSNIFDQFKKIFFTTVSINLKLLQLLDKVALLSDEKLVLLKGMDLVESLYPNIGVRSMCDIDILVERQKAAIVFDRILEGSRNEHVVIYSEGISKSSVHKKLELKNVMHLPSLGFKNGTIEIHPNLFNQDKFYHVTEKAWASIVPSKGRMNVYRLSNEFMLLHLCTHFYGHSQGYILLRMLCDINELILKYSDTLQWEEIREFCKNPDFNIGITTALSYTFIYFKTQIPQEFLIDDIVRNTPKSLLKLYSGIPDDRQNPLKQLLTDFHTLNSLHDKILYLYRTIVPEQQWIRSCYSSEKKGGVMLSYIRYWNAHKKDIFL